MRKLFVLKIVFIFIFVQNGNVAEPMAEPNDKLAEQFAPSGDMDKILAAQTRMNERKNFLDLIKLNLLDWSETEDGQETIPSSASSSSAGPSMEITSSLLKQFNPEEGTSSPIDRHGTKATIGGGVKSVTNDQAQESLLPESSQIPEIRELFLEGFSYQRNSEFNITAKNVTRDFVLNYFQSLNLIALTHEFVIRHRSRNPLSGLLELEEKKEFSENLPREDDGSESETGINLIGILPSRKRSQGISGPENLIVIASHYDTVQKCPGVDDNGSGSVTVLTAAKILAQFTGRAKSSEIRQSSSDESSQDSSSGSNSDLEEQLKQVDYESTSILFVLFDLEEKGLLGSIAFVQKYLIPVELMGNGNKLIGSFVADMMLTYDPNPGSQSITPDVAAGFPEVVIYNQQNDQKGDWMAIWSRKNIDDFLFDKINSNWNHSSPYKLYLMNPNLPKSNPNSIDMIRAGFFMRSDHAAFWYHRHATYETLNAILLNDMGPERGYQTKCYHMECDDKTQLTDDNLGFMKTAIDAIVLSVHQFAIGK